MTLLVILFSVRTTFFKIYDLPFPHFPNTGKINVIFGPKNNYFFYLMSSRTNRIVVFNNSLLLICSQPRCKRNLACNFFFFFKYFLINLLWAVFMQNKLSRFVELLHKTIEWLIVRKNAGTFLFSVLLEIVLKV